MQIEGWRLETVNGFRVVLCEALLDIPGLAHVFSTRQGRDSDAFDVGAFDSDSPIEARRRTELFGAAGFDGAGFALVRQVHGTRVVPAQGLSGPVEADAVVARRTDRPRLAPAVRTADCVPILISEETGEAVAAVHAGWRGTVDGVVVSAVEALSAAGYGPGGLVAALGPAIGARAYEVGPEVLREAAGRPELGGLGLGPAPVTGGRFDLHRANRLLLESAGVPSRAIHSAPWCTRESADLFFSYRRDGGSAGRMIAGVGWASTP